MSNEGKILAALEQIQNDITGLKQGQQFLERGQSEIITKIDNLDARVEIVETKIDKLDARVGIVETKIDKLDARVGIVETKIDKLDAKFDDLEIKNAERHIELIQNIQSISKDLTVVEAVTGKNMQDIDHGNTHDL